MKTYTVQYSERAATAVQAQFRYVAVKKKAPLNAKRWFARLRAETDALSNLPRRHGVDQVQSAHFGTDVYRMVFERTYQVFYTVADDLAVVEIVIFKHGARELDGDE